ncbi:hypothetical protein [Microbacterium sp. NPDC056057]|uniref:hypothetical protein n=1 Tax=Microbacterium sp. NPDC056057 TaxID=3345699 RepID=UPI0035E11279
MPSTQPGALGRMLTDRRPLRDGPVNGWQAARENDLTDGRTMDAAAQALIGA